MAAALVLMGVEAPGMAVAVVAKVMAVTAAARVMAVAWD